MTIDWGWIAGHFSDMWEATTQHVTLTVIAVSLGFLVAMIASPLIVGGAPFSADALMAKLLRWVVQAVTEQQGSAPAATPPPAAAVPGGPVQLSGAKAAALQDVNAALDNMAQAQTSGDFAEFGEALQRLDDAMNKYREAR